MCPPDLKSGQPQSVADDEKRSVLRSSCPVAGALDLVGDRWTLLVIRDLLRGKHKYGDLAASAERIPTNILADRLRRLEQAGLVERTRYSARPPRYEYRLTRRGKDLGPAIRSLAEWGVRYVPGTRLPADVEIMGTAESAGAST
jgi:DNA-binding HxlR family transcriptional regulator